MPTVNVQSDEDAKSEATTEEITTEQAAAPVATEKSSKLGKLKVPKRFLIEVVLVLVIAGLAIYGWNQHSNYKNANTALTALRANPQQAVQDQTKSLITAVGKLYGLPTGETPTVAAVTDAAQAKKQSAFFANAQNGDKVLLYVKAGEAILYRPSSNKIVLVAPLTFSNSTTGTTTDTTKK